MIARVAREHVARDNVRSPFGWRATIDNVVACLRNVLANQEIKSLTFSHLDRANIRPPVLITVQSKNVQTTVCLIQYSYPRYVTTLLQKLIELSNSGTRSC